MLADAFHAAKSQEEQQEIINQILASDLPMDKGGKSLTVKEYLDNAIRFAPKSFTGNIMSILFTALRRNVADPNKPWQNVKDISFANRLIGTARHIGKEVNLDIRAKSKIKNIWDESAKDFLIPDWIQEKIPIPEHVTDPQATRLLQGQRAFEAYAWKNWEYDGQQTQGIDPNNPPSTFMVTDEKGRKVAAPWTRVRKAFDEFNRVTDVLLKMNGAPIVPRVNCNDGKASHQDTRAHYQTRYKNLGLLEPLKKLGLSELSPFAIRGKALSDAIKANLAQGGKLEQQINAGLPPDQQISLNKADYESGGRFWVRDDMVNPINKSLSPSQLMNLRDISRQGKQSLDMNVGGEGEGVALQDLIENKGTTVRDMAEKATLRGTEIEPRMELTDPINNLIPLPLGQTGPTMDRIKKKNFSIPLLQQVMEDWLLKNERDKKTDKRERAHLSAAIMNYIQRTELPARQLYEKVGLEVSKELGLKPGQRAPEAMISKKIVDETTRSLLDGYANVFYKHEAGKYEDEYGTQPSADAASQIMNKAQTLALQRVNMIKSLAADLMNNVKDVGNTAAARIPQTIQWYKDELAFEAEDPETANEAQLKGRIADLMAGMAQANKGTVDNVQGLSSLQNDPVLQAPIAWERGEGKHLTPKDRLVYLVNEVSRQLLGQMFHEKLEAEIGRQAAQFAANQIRLAKFVLLSSIYKAA